LSNSYHNPYILKQVLNATVYIKTGILFFFKSLELYIQQEESNKKKMANKEETTLNLDHY
jgi:hypothetical protein